jgi:hypothetical protein
VNMPPVLILGESPNVINFLDLSSSQTSQSQSSRTSSQTVQAVHSLKLRNQRTLQFIRGKVFKCLDSAMSD